MKQFSFKSSKKLMAGLLAVLSLASVQANAAVITQSIFLDSISVETKNNPFDTSLGQIGSVSYDTDVCDLDFACSSFGIVSDISLNLNISGLTFDASQAIFGNPFGTLLDTFDSASGISGLSASLFDGANSVAISDNFFIILDEYSNFFQGIVSFGDPIVGAPEANAVPEPSTLALLSAGLFGLMWQRKRV